MNITTVGYTRLKNLGNFENQKVHASSAVEEGQDPVQVLNDVKEWVHEQLGQEIDVRHLQEKKYVLQSNVNRLEQSLKRLQQQWEAAVELLEGHGVKVTEVYPSWYYGDHEGEIDF